MSTQHPAARRHGPSTYYLIATGADGDALYEWRNYRMGGRAYLIVNPDGTTRPGDRETWTKRGPRLRPKPPSRGKWRWLKEDA